jgi:AcrR family transcriptional regulator
MAAKRHRDAKDRQAGNDTANRILLTARTLLMNKGYAQFSMRNVAATAGAHLNNVQYYFPTREDLVRALLADTEARYEASFKKLRDKAPDDRLARFRSIMEFSLRDVATLETRRFIIQLWALLSTMDGTSGSLLNELHRVEIQHLSECVCDLIPGLEVAEARRRATLLAAVIEGMTVVQGAYGRADKKQLTMFAHETALHIALGLPTHAG